MIGKAPKAGGGSTGFFHASYLSRPMMNSPAMPTKTTKWTPKRDWCNRSAEGLEPLSSLKMALDIQATVVFFADALRS